MPPKRPPHTLTPEQMALSEARKAKRLKESQQKPQSNALVNEEKGKIIERPWISLHDPPSEVKRIKVATWNLLAQCLVRRELFPTSDCLKAAQREHMIYREIILQSADILCLQEVDRLERLLLVLEQAGYAHHYAAGPGKKHGCLIAFKKEKFSEIHSRVILYDEQEIRDEGSEKSRRGCSFRTKNIGLVVALQETETMKDGIIIATTHLFWHPRYTYERARQAGILKREVVAFQLEKSLNHWSCIISGDFNFAPDDAAYSLLVGQPILPDHESSLDHSRVVHVSIDPTVVPSSAGAVAEEEDGDPDRIITNARRAIPTDGLLTSTELTSLFRSTPPLISAYDMGLKDHHERGGSLATFGDRISTVSLKKGFYEPEWTSYTHYWKTVLDYIFILENECSAVVCGFLAPHRTIDLEPGLPRQDVGGSDHVLLCAEIGLAKAKH